LLWNRADLEAYIMLIGGFILLLVEIGLFIHNFGVFSPYLGDIIPIYAGIFAIPILFMIGGAIAYKMVGGKLDHTFPLQYADATRLIEAVLRRRGISYKITAMQPRWLASLQPKVVMTIERWSIRIEVLGHEEQSKFLGPFSRVYIGKITKENKEEVEGLLREIENAGKPSILAG